MTDAKLRQLKDVALATCLFEIPDAKLASKLEKSVLTTFRASTEKCEVRFFGQYPKNHLILHLNETDGSNAFCDFVVHGPNDCVTSVVTIDKKFSDSLGEIITEHAAMEPLLVHQVQAFFPTFEIGKPMFDPDVTFPDFKIGLVISNGGVPFFAVQAERVDGNTQVSYV